MSNSLRQTVPSIELLREVTIATNIDECDDEMKHAVSKDDNGVMELEKDHKMRLRTKHVAIKYQQFHSFLHSSFALIEKVDAAD